MTDDQRDVDKLRVYRSINTDSQNKEQTGETLDKIKRTFPL